MNALARETSPYLRQHASNPVDWKPWGDEAWQLAREENKPIFLSIGYSTCHWCHVMAHESFENPVLAELLNREFVPVKVDREERPDLDHLYMLFVQATTGQGGWPMSVWLTPDLKPFYGGTYFSPEDRWGRPGFGTVLERISELWHAEQSSIVQQSDQILLNLAQSTAGSSETALPNARSLEMGFQQSASQYDPAEGGFSRAPKFPRPSMFNFLLRYADRRETDPLQRKQARELVLHTLDKMAAGGMYDQLGGGFHRYSVDAEWHVPHFEKMLYDQAQLVVAYLEAYQLTGRPRYAMVIRETLDYVRRQLTSELGGFYAAEDADSLKEAGRADHAEGAFYVWAAEEIDGILGPEESARFKNEYGVKPSGNAPAGSDPHEEFVGLNILKLQSQGSILDPGMEKARKKLWAVRELRPRPHRDEKIITAWNGLMISALARAGAALHRVDDLGVAEKAADFVLTRLTDGDGLLLRTYCEGPGSVKGFASDYACFIQGLLDLFESTGTLRWLRAAWQLQQQMDRLFWDARQGGYFEASDEDPSLLLRLKETYDGAEPAANSIAASNLLRLGDLLGQAKLHEGATRIFQSAASVLTQSPTAVPQLQAALTRFLAPPVHLVITGDPADPRTEALWRVAQEVFLPQKSLLLLPPEGSLSFLGHQADFFDGLRAAATQPSAFLCEELRCHRPVTEPGQLRELISGVGTKGERPEARG